VNRDAALRRAASALVAAGTALQDAAQALAEATGEEGARRRKPRKGPVFEPPLPEPPSELAMARAAQLLKKRGVTAA
jgi:malonyl CoA-acyl carrier protein transacylase